MATRATMATAARPAATAGGYHAVAHAARLRSFNADMPVSIQRVRVGRTSGNVGGRA